LSTIATPRSSTGLARWAMLGGVVYVVLFAVGVILLFGNAPDSGSAPAKIVAYYSDSGHRTRINIGWLVAGLGIFFFLWFLSALRQTIRRLEGGDGFLTGLVTLGGGAYAALSLGAVAVDTGIRTMSDDTYHHQVFPGLIHAADDASWLLHASGGAGLGSMIIAPSLAGLRAAAVPRWAGWLGVAAGILSLALIVFFPWFVAAAWILVVSIGMFARASRRGTAKAEAVAA
jgi:hypothetical protein